jgi:hypothetical protein
MTLKGILSNTFWSTVLVRASLLCRSSYLPLPLWTFLCGLHYLNLVAHPDRAVFDNARAYTTATLQSLRHTRLGKAFDMPADRAWPSVLERNLPHTEPLATSQGLQAYPFGNDVAPVLAFLHPYTGLSLDVVEVRGGETVLVVTPDKVDDLFRGCLRPTPRAR